MAKKSKKEEVIEEILEENPEAEVVEEKVVAKAKQTTKVWTGVGWKLVDEDSEEYKPGKA